jgi:hypothetical protein
MRVLLACEESQAVCIEFRKLGIEAFSCDIEDCSGGYPEWHIKDDVLNVIKQNWDLMIAFPPCTHLAVSGAKHFEQKIKDGRQQQGIDFFMQIVNAPINKIAIENPIGIMSNIYRKPDQIIQPYYFGDEAQKTTCLWLKNMPKLYHNEKPNLFDDKITHVGKGEFLTFSSGKRMPKWYSNGDGNKRSKTFKGIAKAMATQWSKS